MTAPVNTTAAPNTIAALCLRLPTRMQALASQFARLKTKRGDERAPEVIVGFLAPKAEPDYSRYPFIAVRPVGGADAEENRDQDSRVTMEIVAATYSDEDDGFIDAVNLLDAIRVDLAQHPILDGTAFHHVGPLTWAIEIARPEWLIRIATQWQIPRPERALPEDF
jgi:hypothetical protein